MNTSVVVSREAKKVAEKLLTSEGGTYTRRKGLQVLRQSGYAVGKYKMKYTLRLRETDPYLTNLFEIGRFLEQLPVNVDYVGVWHKDGIIYVDSVEIFDDYFDAILAGMERDEEAIYDFSTQQEIRLK